MVKAWGRILRAMGQGKRNFGKGWGKGFVTAEAANKAEKEAQLRSWKRVEALNLENYPSQESFRRWKPVRRIATASGIASWRAEQKQHNESEYHGKGKDKDKGFSPPPPAEEPAAEITPKGNCKGKDHARPKARAKTRPRSA